MTSILAAWGWIAGVVLLSLLGTQISPGLASTTPEDRQAAASPNGQPSARPAHPNAWENVSGPTGIVGNQTLQRWQFDAAQALTGGSAHPGSGGRAVGVEGLTATPTVDGTWETLTPPSPRKEFSTVYDPVRDRLIVVGGWTETNPQYLNDVWELDLAGVPTWKQISATGGPSGRRAQSVIYDPIRDRLVLFGGYWDDISPIPPTIIYYNDVWVLPLSGAPVWSELHPAGTAPAERYDHTAIYDPVRDQMVVFGGGNAARLNDVWTLSLSGGGTWSRVTVSGTPPSGRIGASAIYDPVRDQMVVFGGNDGAYRNDTWALGLSSPTWSGLSPSGTPPPVRWEHTAIYDALSDQMVIFGGQATSYGNDTWSLSLGGAGSWLRVSDQGQEPYSRSMCGAIYDPPRTRMLVFGGFAGRNLAQKYRNDTWSLSLTGTPTWVSLFPMPGTQSGVDPPYGRYLGGAIYDQLRDQLVIWGGNAIGGSAGDPWSLSLDASRQWRYLEPTGPAWISRIGAGVVYDALRDRMLVIAGGLDCTAIACYMNDVWALSLGGHVWSQVTPVGTLPPPRWRHAAVYDPVRDRVIVFGGRPDNEDCHPELNDTWALSLGDTIRWTQILPVGEIPPRRFDCTAVYDPVRDRILIFDGRSISCNPNLDILYGDTWALSLSGTPAWTKLSPIGPAPQARMGQEGIYDPVRDRVVIFGGSKEGCNCPVDEVWALNLAGQPSWTRLQPTALGPTPRFWHAATYDTRRDRMLVFGGYDRPPYFNDVWALGWNPDATPVELLSFTAESIESTVVLRWSVDDARDVVGFHVYRAQAGGSPAQMTTQPLGGESSYEFVDELPPPGPVQYWLAAIERSGKVTWFGPVTPTPSSSGFTGILLGEARPNPFTGQTAVSYVLSVSGSAQIAVYDSLGRKIRLLSDEVQHAGRHSITWDGRQDSGGPAPSGVYYVRLVSSGSVRTQKIVLAR